MGVEGLADRHRHRPHLPVADRDVVGDRVAGDHLLGALDGDVAAAGADHDRQLPLVVELVGDLRHVDVGAGADDAGRLLVEEHRHLGRLHAALGDVVGVVEGDRQVLAGAGRAEQADLGERRPSPASETAAARPSGPPASPARPPGPAAGPSRGRSPGRLRRARARGSPASENRQSLMGVVLFLRGGDRRQVLRSQQGEEGAAVDDRQAALLQLRVGAGEARHLAGEVGLVADQKDVAAAGGERRSRRSGRRAAPRRSRARCRAARRRAARFRRPAAWGWSGRRRAARPAPPGPAPAASAWRSPLAVSRRAASSPSPSSASPCRRR